MKIGIATTTYNTGKYFEKCRESVYNQIFDGDIVHVVYDNGSTDNTVELIDDSALSGFFLLESKENSGGAAKPYNEAMRLLAESCDAVWRVDSDDYLNDRYAVQKMSDLLFKTKSDWVNCHCMGFGEKDWELGCVEGAKYQDLKDSNQLTCFGMFKSSTWLECGGYDENAGYEDWELWVRLLKSGYKYAVLKDPVYSYRLHAVQYHKELGKKHQNHHDYILKKHFGEK